MNKQLANALITPFANLTVHTNSGSVIYFNDGKNHRILSHWAPPYEPCSLFILAGLIQQMPSRGVLGISSSVRLFRPQRNGQRFPCSHRGLKTNKPLIMSIILSAPPKINIYLNLFMPIRYNGRFFDEINIDSGKPCYYNSSIVTDRAGGYYGYTIYYPTN